MIRVAYIEFNDVKKIYKMGEVEITRSEEHTSELQSRSDLVCRLLLEKKNKIGSPRLPPITRMMFFF